jgi:hypothetical protein
MPTLGSLARFGAPQNGYTGYQLRNGAYTPPTGAERMQTAQNNAARMMPGAYAGAMGGTGLPGAAQAFGTFGKQYGRAMNPSHGVPPAQRPQGSGAQSGYQTPAQLLALAQGGMDLNAQVGPGGSLLRQLMNVGQQGLAGAGADPALLAKIKAGAQGAYQGQIDQNNAMKAYWGQEGNNPGGAIDTGLYDRSIAQFLQQMGRWA